MEEVRELVYWAIINDYEVFDFEDIRKIRHSFESIIDFWNAPNERLVSLGFKNLKKFYKIKTEKKIQDYSSLVNEHIIKKKTEVFSIFDRNYPFKLRNREQYPFLIYKRGKINSFEKCIGIVGARNASHFGHKKARELAQYFAEEEYIIVAGMARGIDTEAHCGALDVNGKTIAVLPTISTIYPPENQELAIDIENNGAIVSGRLSPLKKDGSLSWFVKRNRIISGISDFLIVVESNGIGGSYHQVTFALKQGIPVFVPIPPNKERSAYKGFLKFKRLGAIPFESPTEILDKIESISLSELRKSNSKKIERLLKLI